jgi:hypothetical protein
VLPEEVQSEALRISNRRVYAMLEHMRSHGAQVHTVVQGGGGERVRVSRLPGGMLAMPWSNAMQCNDRRGGLSWCMFTMKTRNRDGMG